MKSKEKIAYLEDSLEKAREHIRKLKEEVTTQREALERRNREADALGRVWCDGGCGGGMDRYRKDYGDPPAVTADQVAFLLRNARRAYSWYVNRGSKLRLQDDNVNLEEVWKARREDVALALVEQHEAEVQRLSGPSKPRKLSPREYLDLAAKNQVTDEETLAYLEHCYFTDRLSRDSREKLNREILELREKLSRKKTTY